MGLFDLADDSRPSCGQPDNVKVETSHLLLR